MKPYQGPSASLIVWTTNMLLQPNIMLPAAGDIVGLSVLGPSLYLYVIYSTVCAGPMCAQWYTYTLANYLPTPYSEQALL